MLSYKKWKQLNENIGGTYTLGLGQPNKVADLHKRWDEVGLPMRSKKKLLDMPPPDDEEEDLGGPPIGKGLLGKKKKPLGPPPDEEMAPEDEEDIDDEDMDDEDPALDMDDEEDLEDEEDLDDEEPPMEPPMDDEEEDMPLPPLKKSKGGMKGIVGKTRTVADGAKMMHKGAQKMIKGMKEAKGCDCGKCKECKKMAKKCMTKEEVEFFRSLRAQTGTTRFVRDKDGDFVAVKEDAIIPPSDPNAGLNDDEPGPGEVGYAPQGRMGSIGSYAEWSKKHKGRTSKKINESTKKTRGTWFQ
jgi:hypothetical protein